MKSIGHGSIGDWPITGLADVTIAPCFGAPGCCKNRHSGSVSASASVSTNQTDRAKKLPLTLALTLPQ
jgi:hypothetical protein